MPRFKVSKTTVNQKWSVTVRGSNDMAYIGYLETIQT